ncbi:CAAX amino terminal protease family protein [Tasmannia lanceolata]|uniref:CAAX amino terminal protease family protein n=1 Tax=Tasmannia lanceolata TaxID=3420 RepID=UPI0040645E7C
MISSTSSFLLVQSSHLTFPNLPKLSPSKKNLLSKGNNAFLFSTKNNNFSVRLYLRKSKEILGFGNVKKTRVLDKGFSFVCSCDKKEKSEGNFTQKDSGLDWPILEPWDVPWKWQTVILTMIGCGLGFVLTGLVVSSVAPYLGIQGGNLSSDEKAEILFVDQFIVTAVVLGVVYGVTNTFQPLPDEIFCYKWEEPFNLQKGWLLWAGIGFVGALLAIALTGAGLALFNGETPQRETDALIRLSPLIGSSSISTACLVGITGFMAPLLEETVFRGFLMVSLTKWFPAPVSVLLSAAVFALAHFTPGEFPQLFVLGVVLGFSYAQTRNLLTPMAIHSLWNSGVILLLTFLQLQGYDIRELLQGS